MGSYSAAGQTCASCSLSKPQDQSDSRLIPIPSHTIGTAFSSYRNAHWISNRYPRKILWTISYKLCDATILINRNYAQLTHRLSVLFDGQMHICSDTQIAAKAPQQGLRVAIHRKHGSFQSHLRFRFALSRGGSV